MSVVRLSGHYGVESAILNLYKDAHCNALGTLRGMEEFMSEQLCQLTATELVEAYATRRLSPVEVAAAVLARIETLNEEVNAFCYLEPEATLAAARASEARWRGGEPAGRLDGVPVSVKDLVLTKGWPTIRGSRTTDPGQRWDEDAPSVARLREHGAVIVGKTTTPEFGWKGVTDNLVTGVTRNPWNHDRTSGGSSGGAAVAAACGMGALHIGTDGGGSVRIPAAFCGIVGLKASAGRVPIYPPSPFGTLAHVGPMCRTVADTALMLTVMAEPDVRDPLALEYDARDYTSLLAGGVAGVRIGYSPDLGYATVDPQVAALAEAAAGMFEELGAIVEQAAPGFDDPQEVFRTHWYTGAAYLLRKLSKEQRSLLDPGLQEASAAGARYTLTEYFDAVQARNRLIAAVRRFYETYDLLLTPAMPTTAFPLGSNSPIGANGEGWVDWSPFTFPFNLSGQPAISVPCGLAGDGLPVGLQIVGRQFDDVSVLRAAAAFADSRPAHTVFPATKG